MASANVDESSSAAAKGDPCGYKLLASCPHGLRRDQLSVVFDKLYDRIPHPDADLENSVNELWEQRVRKNGSLYNGMKFRYGGHSLQGEDNGKKYSKISLNLGLTDYRTFVGTNLNPSWANFLFPSDGKTPESELGPSSVVCSPRRLLKMFVLNELKFKTVSGINTVSFTPLQDASVPMQGLIFAWFVDNAERCQHMASPLGNGAIVETSDDMILVLQRSENVGEFPGYFVFPGGHPEPNEVGILSHQCDTDVDSEMINKKISNEMFDSIIREVVEEIGVPAESLSDPIFIGISLREVNVRPAAFFYIKCNLSPEAIHHFYSDAQDGYESTKLLALPKINAYGWTSRMPGCHQGGYALYEAMLTAKYDV